MVVGLIRALAAVVSVAIILAGLVMPGGAHSSDATQAAAAEMVMTAQGGDCHQSEGKKSADHQTQMACGSGMSCLVLAESGDTPLLVFPVGPAYTARVDAVLVTRSITPPSPPPKSIVAA